MSTSLEELALEVSGIPGVKIFEPEKFLNDMVIEKMGVIRVIRTPISYTEDVVGEAYPGCKALKIDILNYQYTAPIIIEDGSYYMIIDKGLTKKKD